MESFPLMELIYIHIYLNKEERMEFIKYQHVERLGNIEVEGLLDGLCHVFPKIDGTNGSIWVDNGIIKAGSRNRELSVEKDNAGFYEWALEQQNIKEFLGKYPNLRLYGEWLVPHTLKTYIDTAWRNFYVFDVLNGKDYLPYEEYTTILDEFGINYIPALCTIKNASEDEFYNFLDSNTFLIRDGAGTGEGIVIKNYSYKNKFGRTTWAKIVKNDFKEQNKKPFGLNEEMIEKGIVNMFVTETLIRKEFSKIENWNSKLIPRLLNTVYYCLIKEELWNALKKFKSPIINFKELIRFSNLKVKETLPELF